MNFNPGQFPTYKSLFPVLRTKTTSVVVVTAVDMQGKKVAKSVAKGKKPAEKKPAAEKPAPAPAPAKPF